MTNTALDFNVLPLAQACDLLQRVALHLAHQVLAQQPMSPLSTLLLRGEERLLTPASRAVLRRHRKAAGLKRLWRPWAAQPLLPDLRAASRAWRHGSVSPQQCRVSILEHIELDYQGVTIEHVPAQFWQLAGIRAWRNLEFQYELAHAARSALRTRVLLTAADVRSLFPCEGAVDMFAPQTFWLLLAAADTCPSRASWRRSERRRRLAAARLQEIADPLVSTERWAGFMDQWLILELARQDWDWFGNLSPQAQCAVGALPLIRAVPSCNPCPPVATDTEQNLHLASWDEALPGWFQRLYPHADKAEPHDN